MKEFLKSSVFQTRHIAFSLIGLMVIAVFVLVMKESMVSAVVLPTAKISVGSTELLVEVADEPNEQARGLSGRMSLLPGQGMLFLFEHSERRGFWMKDMNFPLDFIWIHDGRIAEISRKIAPPKEGNDPIPFYPKDPIEAVLEVPAGYAGSQGWQVGDSVSLKP